mgnify:CR=1 FL=1
MNNRYFSIHKSNGDFTWASEEILNVTGYDNIEIIDKNPYNYIFKKDEARVLKKHLAGIWAISEKNIQDLKFRWEKKDKSKVWVQAYLTKYKDGLICFTIKMKWWEILKFKIKLFFETRYNKSVIIEM